MADNDVMDLIDGNKCRIKMRRDGTAIMDCAAELSPQMLGMVKKVSNIAQDQLDGRKRKDPE